MKNYERHLSLQQDGKRLVDIYSTARWALSVKSGDSLVSSDEAKLILNSKNLEVLDFDTIFETVAGNLRNEAEAKACALLHRLSLTPDLDWVHFWHGGEQQVYIVPNHIFETVDFLILAERKHKAIMGFPKIGSIPLNLMLLREEYLPMFLKIPGVGEPLTFNQNPASVFLRRIYAPLMPLYVTLNRRETSTSKLGPAKIYELPTLKGFILAASSEHRASLAQAKYPLKEEQILEMASLARKLFRVYKDIVCISSLPVVAHSSLSVMWSGACNETCQVEGWVTKDETLQSVLRKAARASLNQFADFTHREFANQSLSKSPHLDFFSGWNTYLGFSSFAHSNELGTIESGYDTFWRVQPNAIDRHSETLLALKELLPREDGSVLANLKIVPKDYPWAYYTERTDNIKGMVDDLSIHGVTYMVSPSEFMPFSKITQMMQTFVEDVFESEVTFSEQLEKK